MVKYKYECKGCGALSPCRIYSIFLPNHYFREPDKCPYGHNNKIKWVEK